MASTNLHLYKVYNHLIDYSKVWSGDFSRMVKEYYGKVNLGYYLPLNDECDVQLNSELLRTRFTASKNLMNPTTQYYGIEAVGEATINGDNVIVKTSTLTGAPYVAAKFYITGLTTGNNYTFRGYYTIVEGTETANDFNFRIQSCDTSKTGVGSTYALGSSGVQTFVAATEQAIVWCVNRNSSSTQTFTNATYYNMQLEAGTSATKYEANTSNEYNAFNDVNYIVAENDDETRYYFVKDKKTRVAENTRLYSLKADEWFEKGLNSGIDCVQYGGHNSDDFDIMERKEYVEKPQFNASETAITTAAAANGSNSNVTGTVIAFYKTVTSMLAIAKSFISASLLNDICIKLFNTTKFRASTGVDEIDVTCVRAYIIPNLFTTASFSTTYTIDVYSLAAWTDNYCRYVVIGETQENTLTINMNHNAELYPYANKTLTEIIALNLPLKLTAGVLGQTFEIDSPVIRDTTTSCVIKTRLVVGTNDLSAAIQADFTDNKWVEVSSAFEEVVTYSEYYQFVNQNRDSIANQRRLNQASIFFGAVGVLATGNVEGLVNAIGSYASTESGISDKLHKSCISTGNQGGFINLTYSASKGCYLFVLYKQTCRNSASVYEAIMKYGYNFDRVSTNTNRQISLRHYTYETQAKGTYVDTALVEPKTGSYNSFRYMVADLINGSNGAKISPDIMAAFKRGVYVCSVPVTA